MTLDTQRRPTRELHRPAAVRPSDAARARLEADGGAFLVSDWLRVVFIHFEADPAALQRQVPFELDLFAGRARVSLVAFSMERLRLGTGGRLTQWVSAPLARHGFLNLRTYVRHAGEPGIFFLAEWLPNTLATLLGPKTFGLPYRWGRLSYAHTPGAGAGELTGTAEPGDGGGRLAYRAAIDAAPELAPSEPGSREAFVAERYTAFTMERRVRRRFRIWHEPWPLAAIDPVIDDASLLETSGVWFASARLIGGHYSPGVRDVSIGRPRCLQGEACGTVWRDELTPGVRRGIA